jgi:hypothetical protein
MEKQDLRVIFSLQITLFILRAYFIPVQKLLPRYKNITHTYYLPFLKILA